MWTSNCFVGQVPGLPGASVPGGYPIPGYGPSPGQPVQSAPAGAPMGSFLNPNVVTHPGDASPLMTLALVAALAGGGALVGWLWLHSQKAAIIGGGLGLAAGALSSLATSDTWKGST